MSSLQRPLTLVAVVVAACLSLSPSMSAISPEAAAVQLQMAQLLFSDGRYGEAFDSFEALKASEDPKIRRESLRGSVQTALRLGDFSHAFADVQVLMRNAGHDADALTLYGDSLWAIGQFEESEKQYQLALELAPGHPRALHGTARQQPTTKAEQSWRYLRISPKHKYLIST